MFCLDDGAELLYGPASINEPATAILSAFGEAPLKGQNREEKTQVFAKERIDDAIHASNSIAVLPFANISADADNEYFCDGLAEDLLNALANIEDLNVAARTSTFSFRGKDADVATIGHALGVRTVMEGSVRRSGNRLRINVQLINAADGYHIWSERYDREMNDIFDIQDEITLAVVEALKLKLLGGEKHSAFKRQTDNPDAYKAYLRGRYLRLTKNDHAGAMRAFEEAVRLDPSHAPSWVGVAEGTILAAHYSIVPAREACSAAKVALANAKALQGESGESFYVQGFIAFVEARWSDSETSFRKAMDLQPRLIYAQGSFGLTLCVRNRFRDADIIFERAQNTDPLASFPYAITGVGRVLEGRLEDSLVLFEQAFAFEPENALALWGNCIANVALGKFEAGVRSAETAVRVSGRAAFFVGLLGWAFARAGRLDEARSILDELEMHAADRPIAVSDAWLLSELGEIDAAFKMLNRAIDDQQPFAYYVRLPTFDRLRVDKRFKDLVARLGLVEDN